MSLRLLTGSLVIFFLTSGIAHSEGNKPVENASIEILQFKPGLSNLYLIKSRRPILVDAGGVDDLPKIIEFLATHGLKFEDIAMVIPTHGHSDHAGTVAQIKRLSPAKIVLGEGDVEMAKAGHNDELKPTSFMAKLLKRFAIDPNYEPFVPDIVVTDNMDLAEYGIPGKVVAMSGHTPGSLVILLDDNRALVGDMMLGGYLGGAIFPERAGQHYFHTDQEKNLENIKQLLLLPIETFYLGHGGPVTRESVLKGFDLTDPLK